MIAAIIGVAVPLFLSFVGLIFQLGRLTQRVDDCGKRITRLEMAYSTGCKGRNDNG
jgi:hypothetical protein